MSYLINGIHHITAIAGDPHQTINFYSNILGLRLIKKTINFDAPEIYHLFFGNRSGEAGTMISFFTYGNDINDGSRGCCQAVKVSFSIPMEAVSFWVDRLKHYGIRYTGPIEYGNETIINFEDFDGLGIALVANDKDNTDGYDEIIDTAFAIKGVYSVALCVSSIEESLPVFTEILEHRKVLHPSEIRLESGRGGPGTYVTLIQEKNSTLSLPGKGTIHHVSFCTPDDETQLNIREKLVSAGYHVTDVVNRKYFHSIYFREPGRISIEIATELPGMTIDESIENLGKKLQLPEWEESRRQIILKNLVPLHRPAFKK